MRTDEIPQILKLLEKIAKHLEKQADETEKIRKNNDKKIR